MADLTRNKQSRGAAGRLPSGIGPVWKSGILAGGMGAVLVGWAILLKVSGPMPSQQTPASISQAQPSATTNSVNINVASPALPSQNQASVGSLGTTTLNSIPAMPQRPIFQMPITRTRRS